MAVYGPKNDFHVKSIREDKLVCKTSSVDLQFLRKKQSWQHHFVRRKLERYWLKRFSFAIFKTEPIFVEWYNSQFFLMKYCVERVSQYIRETYVHKERKGHPQIAWKLEETVLIL